MKQKWRMKYPPSIHKILTKIANDVAVEIPELALYTEYRTGSGDIYRASPYYLGKAWNDWALCDFGGSDNIFPCQIYAYIDLRKLPENHDSGLKPGIIALVEKATISTSYTERNKSELFEPFYKIMEYPDDGDKNGKERKQMIYIDVKQIIEPICMIPDMGNKTPGAYLMITAKEEWADGFEQWLRTTRADQEALQFNSSDED